MCKPCYTKENPSKPLERTPIKKSTTRLPSVSQQQKERNRIYKDLRDEYLKTHGICECCNQAIAEDIHHKAGRIGDNLFKHFLAVCRPCHQRIEENPEWAKDNGFSISRLT